MEKKIPPARATGKPARAVKKSTTAAASAGLFPIVGIGASAGGFEALELFIQHVPDASGMAFVVVQHMDPTRKGLLAEFLQRCTRMQVVQVKDRTRVRPDHVYVIPPNKDMSILHGMLHLFEPAEKRGLRLPVDFFLRSLALDRQEHGIGVVLSGMGSDGTKGSRDLKAKGGLVVAQDPAGAKFDSMPRHVIEAGLADIVAAVEDMPAKIITRLGGAPPALREDEALESKLRGGLEKILILLRTRTGHDFSFYKKNTLYRRVERRMGIHQIDTIVHYVRFLSGNPQELDLLFKEFLIGVTGFFRDPQAWEVLRGDTFPAMLAKHPEGPVRAWVAGCSTGEEAYTLAIVFKEVMENLQPRKSFKFQIFATDLDRDAIDKARQGMFQENISADLSPEQLRRFFTKEQQGYRVRTEIREMVVFSPHSLIMDPPFTKLDFLSCRNLLIYLAPEMQKKLFPLFHYSLNPGGILLLGNAETVGHFTDLFANVNGKSRIFRRMESAMRPDPVEFPSSFAPSLSAGSGTTPMPKPYLNLQSQAEQLVLRRHAPPTVLVNEQGNIVHISGRTGRFLEPAAGKANLNIFAMARDGLRHELSAAFQKALRQKGPVKLHGVRIEGGDGTRCAEITVEKLQDTEPLAGLVIVVFSELSAPVAEGPAEKSRNSPATGRRLTEVEQDLHRTRQELQNTLEEMQTSQEELRSTNEEMQSTNEELMTSKEEMQSLNEELQTVNSELQGKLDELSRSHNDMKNLLNSTDVATLFLDNHLKIRRFTTQATHIIKLIPGDVGRPITDLASDLIYPELPDDARIVLRKLGFIEKPINARDGRWFTVRIMPYRTLDDRIDGVVITFWDISAAKVLEAKLQLVQATLETRLADQSVKLDKAKAALKTERDRNRRDDPKAPPPPSNG